jgi:hypothetical protein
MLELSTNRWNSAFNAQGSRPIIVVVQVRAVKICVKAVEALRQKQRQDEISLPPKLMVFWVSPSPWILMYFFAGFFFESHPVYDQTQGCGAMFVLL